jgi:hypothetical protein
MRKNGSNLDEFAQMGIAALLPGMRYLIELMQKAYDERRDLLGVLQEGIETVAPTKPKLGRPPGSVNKPGTKSSGWPDDPEERKTEMLRRMAVRKQNAGAVSSSPAHKDHPDHERWVENIRKAQKQAWKKKTPAQKKAWQEAMLAGRAKGKRKKTAREARANAPVVAMERTA